MEATFRLTIDQLDDALVKKIKSIFNKDSLIELHISDEFDETAYLLSTAANRQEIFESLDQLKRGEFVTKSMAGLGL